MSCAVCCSIFFFGVEQAAKDREKDRLKEEKDRLKKLAEEKDNLLAAVESLANHEQTVDRDSLKSKAIELFDKTGATVEEFKVQE